jgi:hypothetical protein
MYLALIALTAFQTGSISSNSFNAEPPRMPQFWLCVIAPSCVSVLGLWHD